MVGILTCEKKKKSNITVTKGNTVIIDNADMRKEFHQYCISLFKGQDISLVKVDDYLDKQNLKSQQIKDKF